MNNFKRIVPHWALASAYFSLPYISGVGKVSAYVLVILGTVLLWFGSALVVFKKNISGGAGTAVAGTALLALMIGYFGMTWMPSIILSITIGVLALGYFSQQRLAMRKKSPVIPETDILPVTPKPE